MRALALSCLLLLAPGCMTHSLSTEDRNLVIKVINRLDKIEKRFMSIDQTLMNISNNANDLEEEISGVRKATTDLSIYFSRMFGKSTRE